MSSLYGLGIYGDSFYGSEAASSSISNTNTNALLNDDFDRHNGSLSPYVDATGFALPFEKHYDLRAFHTTNLTVPWTTNDWNWWQGYKYPAFTSGSVGSPRSIVNVQSRSRTQTEMDTFTQTQLDALVQTDIEFVGVTAGNEEWTTGATITVGKDSAYRYSNTIRVTLTSGVSQSVSSYFVDDIYTDFEQAELYNIELVLRSFPAQADAAHLDLANSSIDISSDVNFSPTQTDTLTFTQSTNALTGTSGSIDTYAKWPLTSIVKADRRSIKAIRLNLKSVGNMTFIAQALRITQPNWIYRVVGLDTKRQTLARQVPKAGGTEATSVFGDMYFQLGTPKDTTTVTRLGSGHLPATGTDDNILRLYFRHDVSTGNHIEIRIASRSTQTRLFIDEKVNGVTTNLSSTSTNTNILTAETDYYLVTSVSGTAVTATLYTTNGPILGSQVGTLTTTATTSINQRGRVGMSFEPYMYDFTLRYFGTSAASFGQFISTYFNSRVPVAGATLYPRTSANLDLLTGGAFEGFGDATLTIDGDTDTITRDGTLNQGGVRYDVPVVIGESSQAFIQGSIFPQVQVRGTYRIGLLDENDSAIWIYNLPNLFANQWNDFSVLLPAGLPPVQYYIHIQQFGLGYPDTFELRDVSVVFPSIAWEGTSNGGTNWQYFFNVLNDQFSAVNFANRGKALGVRATAKSDPAYISGYDLVPIYVGK